MAFDLNSLWFVLIAVLFIGFFVLEGFDFGVGILLPFVGRTDAERRRVINTDRPVLGRQRGVDPHGGRRDLRRVPALVRHALQRLLPRALPDAVAMIVRGVAFEFRSKDGIRPGAPRGTG
jgi:cytochrome bd ubiquinol oxidase subunit II